MSGTINSVKKNLQETGQQATKLEQIQQKFNRIEQSSAPLKKKLKDIKGLLAQMNLSGDFNTDLFSQMAQRAGEYKDAISDAGQATSFFADDYYKLQAMAQGLSAITGAGSILTGVMSLLNIENDKAAVAIQKVQAVLAVLNGVESMANILNKDSAIVLRIKQIAHLANAAAATRDTAAEVGNTAATVSNTVAQNAWNVAKAIGKALFGDWTGLVLVGAAALGTYAIATASSTDATEKQNEATNSAKSAMSEFSKTASEKAGELVGSYQALRAEWNMLKTNAEKTQWIKDNQSEFSKLGLSVYDLVDAEKVFVNNTDTVVRAMIARAKAAAAEQLYIDAYKDYFKQADTVAGGGWRVKYKKGDKVSTYDYLQASGITPNESNFRKNQKYELTTDAEVERMNKWSSDKSRQNRQNLDKKFAQKFNYLEDEIKTNNEEANRLLGSLGTSSGSSKGKSSSSRPSTQSSSSNNTDTYVEDDGSLASSNHNLEVAKKLRT